MALQRDLARIEEYNAAIELPHSGLLGLAAYGAKGPRRDLRRAANELAACAKLCGMAEEALSGNPSVAREDVHVYSAWNAISTGQKEREKLRRKLEEISRALRVLLEALRCEGAPKPDKAQIDSLRESLQELAKAIKQAIPRDAYVASIVGSVPFRLGHRG